MDGGGAVVNPLNSINDPLFVASSDHPGMNLTNVPFNGTNFLGWNRSIRLALGAKLKLGFIDGTCKKPLDSDPNAQRWLRCDYMIRCWILNSMTPDLTEAFLYTQSASELWKEIHDRYGQSNGPLIYQLENELSKTFQGSLTVAQYFNKLKRCWDEIHNLNGVPACNCGKMLECTCGVTERFLELQDRSKLIQFLMRLNDNFESVRSNILSMDPLPNINRAYYIVQQIEKQKEVTHTSDNSAAFFADTTGGKTHFNAKKNTAKFESKSDIKRHCKHCNQDGHSVDQCFEIIGYPDWYKGKKKIRRCLN